MKYQLFEDENLVYETNNNEMFSMTVAIQFPLGGFIRVDDCGDRTVITFENYWINITK